MTAFKYYLGLDMGTNSVGWAATDPEYRLLKAKGKDLWGIREFNEASGAVERRTHRISRRRRQREQVRMKRKSISIQYELADCCHLKQCKVRLSDGLSDSEKSGCCQSTY